MYTQEEINHLRKEQFYCPTCHGEVIIRAGPVTIPHFAHRTTADCPSTAGGEGSYHEKGKLLLYQWLKKHNVNVQLEPYLHDVKQQPDVLLHLKKRMIAIEYQCTKISITELQKRNKGYINAGITPIWILGAHLFKRSGTHRLRVNSFLLQCMHQFNASFPLTLYFFCSDSSQLLTVQHLYLLSKGQALATFRFEHLQTLLFPHLFHEQLLRREQFIQLWTNAKRNFRQSQQKRAYGKELFWRQWLYERNLYIEHLPAIVYLPVRHPFLMKTSLWDWQSRIWFEIIASLPIGSLFTIDQCKKLLDNDRLSRNNYPLLVDEEDPILQYLHLLTQLHVVDQVSETAYKKLKHISLPADVEEAFIQDEYVMRQFSEIKL